MRGNGLAMLSILIKMIPTEKCQSSEKSHHNIHNRWRLALTLDNKWWKWHIRLEPMDTGNRPFLSLSTAQISHPGREKIALCSDLKVQVRWKSRGTRQESKGQGRCTFKPWWGIFNQPDESYEGLDPLETRASSWRWSWELSSCFLMVGPAAVFHHWLAIRQKFMYRV